MIQVISPGLYTSIQDLGRFGFRNQGVPNSGAMDAMSARIANSLLNNAPESAVIETTINGPKLLFKSDTIIAITGADMSPKVNQKQVLNNKPITIKKGDVLSFGKLVNGARSYLALKGGVQSEIKLQSRSQFNSVTQNNRLIKNDEIEIMAISNNLATEKTGKISTKRSFFDIDELEVFLGPEFDLLSKIEQDKLLNTIFTISNNSNRMGYQMEEVVASHTISIITSPVLPGTVQLLPSGKIVVLMRDGQTTGGYPRIFQLSELAICVLAQKKVGDRFKLKLKRFTDHNTDS